MKGEVPGSSLAEDTVAHERVLNALQGNIGGGVIRVHHLRAIRAGRFQHVEAHLVVPEFWSVERAHNMSEDVAARVMRDLGTMCDFEEAVRPDMPRVAL